MLIELNHEKSYHVKDKKLQIFNSQVRFDLGKTNRFISMCQSDKEEKYFFSFYFGMGNGQILKLTLSKQLSQYKKYEKLSILTFTCWEEIHSGEVSSVLSKVIGTEEIIISGAVDGKIKLWRIEIDEFNQCNYYKTFPEDISHQGGIIKLAYAKTENFLFSSSKDKSIRIFKIQIINVVGLRTEYNPVLVSVIKDFDIGVKVDYNTIGKGDDSQNNFHSKKKHQTIGIGNNDKNFLDRGKDNVIITSLVIKDEDCIYLYAGDSQGTVHLYEYFDSNSGIKKNNFLLNSGSNQNSSSNNNLNFSSQKVISNSNNTNTKNNESNTNNNENVNVNNNFKNSTNNFTSYHSSALNINKSKENNLSKKQSEFVLLNQSNNANSSLNDKDNNENEIKENKKNNRKVAIDIESNTYHIGDNRKRARTKPNMINTSKCASKKLSDNVFNNVNINDENSQTKREFPNLENENNEKDHIPPKTMRSGFKDGNNTGTNFYLNRLNSSKTDLETKKLKSSRLNKNEFNTSRSSFNHDKKLLLNKLNSTVEKNIDSNVFLHSKTGFNNKNSINFNNNDNNLSKQESKQALLNKKSAKNRIFSNMNVSNSKSNININSNILARPQSKMILNNNLKKKNRSGTIGNNGSYLESKQSEDSVLDFHNKMKYNAHYKSSKKMTNQENNHNNSSFIYDYNNNNSAYYNINSNDYIMSQVQTNNNNFNYKPLETPATINPYSNNNFSEPWGTGVRDWKKELENEYNIQLPKISKDLVNTKDVFVKVNKAMFNNKKRIVKEHKYKSAYDRPFVIEKKKNPLGKNWTYLSSFKFHNYEITDLACSLHDSTFYSISNTRRVVGFSPFDNKIYLDSANYFKSYFTTLIYSQKHKELITGDDKGNITFIQIYNNFQSRVRDEHLSNLNIKDMMLFEVFEGKENLLVLSEECIKILSIKREQKLAIKKYHDKEVIKVFIIEPYVVDGKVKEEAKLITASYDNTIKIWDFVSMENIQKFELPKLSNGKASELSVIEFMPRSEFIILGTDNGYIYFYDLFRACFIDPKYSLKQPHKEKITYISHGENKKGIEVCYIASLDGCISIWELELSLIKMKGKTISLTQEFCFVDKQLAHETIIKKKYLHKMSIKELHEMFLYHVDSIYPDNQVPEELLQKKRFKINKDNITNETDQQDNEEYYSANNSIFSDKSKNIGGEKNNNKKIINHRKGTSHAIGSISSNYDALNNKDINIKIIPKLVACTNLKENLINNHYSIYSYLQYQIGAVCHSKNHNVYVTGCYDGNIYIWNCDNNALIAKVFNHQYKIHKFIIEENVSLIYSFNKEVYDNNDTKNNDQFDANSHSISNSRILDSHKEINIGYNKESKNNTNATKIGFNSLISTSSILLTISEQGEIKVWNLDSTTSSSNSKENEIDINIKKNNNDESISKTKRNSAYNHSYNNSSPSRYSINKSKHYEIINNNTEHSQNNINNKNNDNDQDEFQQNLLLSFNTLKLENKNFNEKYKYDDENKIVILDIIKLKDRPVLIQLSSNNKFSIWNITTGLMLKQIGIKNNIVNCLGFLYTYGKLIIGTKDKSVIDIDVKNIFDNIGLENSYGKNPLLNNRANVELDYLDADINYKKVTDMLMKETIK